MKRIYLIAFILALATGIALFVYLTTDSTVGQTKTAQVVVAAADIPARTVLTRDMLILKEFPKTAVHPQSVTDPESLVGMIAAGPLVMDAPILTGSLLTPGQKDGGFSNLIPMGRRAMSVLVDETTGVAGFISPGDHVDVYVSILATNEDKSASGDGTTAVIETHSILLLQDIEVLAAGSRTTGTLKGDEAAYTTVTLALTPEEGNRLDLSIVEGKVRLVLRAPGDRSVVTLPARIADDIATGK
jgi:pilus assembly protein CpaB